MNETLGQIIRRARGEKGWTQEQFAEKLGKDIMTVYRQEAKNKHFGDDTLKIACQLLGLDYRNMLALKHPEHAAVFLEDDDREPIILEKGEPLILESAEYTISEIDHHGNITRPGEHHNEMIEIAQRQGLIPKKANRHALEAIRFMGSREGAEFQNPEATAQAYKEALKRPEIRLLEAFLQLPLEEQEDVIGIAKYKQSKLKKK